MTNRRRLVLALLVVALILALPATALASKKSYTAQLSPLNVVPPAAGSSAVGAAQFVTRPNGLEFRVMVDGLSGAPTGVQIHAPATTTETGPIVISLCGSPGPAVLATCTYDPATGRMLIQGLIGSTIFQGWGITSGQLLNWMDSSLAYVNVHTANYPSGEVRGQIARQF